MRFIENDRGNCAGFTLVEVVLAIGVLSVAVLALLGMFAPTMNNVKNVMDSDFAISSTGSISAYLKLLAKEDFDDIKNLVTSASETEPGNTFLYLYMRNTEKMEEVYVTTEKGEVIGDLKGGHVLSGVLRIEIYKMLMGNGYDYDRIYEEAYIPMMLKIYSAEPSNPEIGGGLLITYPIIISR